MIISTPESWQAYPWWLADERAPSYARFISWVYRDEGRRARYEEAQMVGAEVIKQDVVVGDGGSLTYRTKVQLSFKYEAD